jgi:hypothetical protein
MSILTVVAHELGHELGLSDDEGTALMGEFLPAGTRRLPSPAVPSIPARASSAVAPAPALASLTAAAADYPFQIHGLPPAR